MRKVLAVAVVAAVLGTAGLVTRGQADAAPPMRALVPLYVLPPESDDAYSDWHRACDSSPAGSAIVANVLSGPGDTLNQNYLAAIQYCALAGQRVLGYVHTEWGRRSAELVHAEIDRWHGLYGSWISGVFVDEMATDIATASYYRALYARANERRAGALVVGNTGTASGTGWHLTQPAAADILVIFEGPAASLGSFAAPEWVQQTPPEQLAALVYETSRETVPAACDALRALPVAWAHVTPETLADNPWDRLPAPAYTNRVRNACR
ncbi:spherulation-specific family 4 protein [Pilimelia columellifera]|uniref:Spherulin 4 n=1 Tax=Pilimelia columellifera subsp. columellifera TaxID=706583 RepID=A0ABN3NFP5_9ACTN